MLLKRATAPRPDRPGAAASASDPAPSGVRAGFRRWRRSRPFWGGLLAVLAGAEICVLPLAPMKIMLQQGVAGIPSVLMGVVMIVLGLTAWFSPAQRGLAGVLTTLIATSALVLSNLGGFLIGTLLGILGGGLMFAWQPYAAQRAGSPKPDGSRTGGSQADGFRTGGNETGGSETAAGTPAGATTDSAPRADPAGDVPDRPTSTSTSTSTPTPHHDPQGAQP
ncbi:DUF6114 domain-containing protein [Streptomyces sp. NPDC055254]